MNHRKLRFAWSVMCGIVAVLLIALWVRSNWRIDVVHLPTQRDVIVNSAYGVIQVDVFPTDIPTGWGSGWGWASESHKNSQKRPAWSWNSGNIRVFSFLMWVPVLISIVVATIPLTRREWRFRLRTLLIATTLVAVGLGLIVWLAR